MLAKLGVELVKKNLNYFTLPSSSSSGFTVKNLRVSSLALPHFTISPSVPDNGMKVRISNARFEIDGSWSYYRSGLFGFSDSGSLDISVSSIELSLVIGVGEKNGQFVISTSSRQCVSNYGPIHVGIYGAGTMVGMYVDDIKSQIRNKMRSQLNEVKVFVFSKVFLKAIV
ncbi:bactericidal permeability-increasing protein-like [Antedon mediterranea]|uniref:bactericidal permeability-increasing protein-like n=1 Tax=Antedon mediterranea TaxID=105859 RepID=UPI003AF54CFA